MQPLLTCSMLVCCAAPGAAQNLLPWQTWVYRLIEAETRDLESVLDLSWVSSGGPEGELSVAQDPGPWGGRRFVFKVKVDYANGVGWPAFEVQPQPPLDFSGYDSIRYWIRCDTALESALTIRFILWSGGVGRIQEVIPEVRRGEWVQATHRLTDVPALDKVDRLHFFLCESDYQDGDEMTFEIGGFQLCRLEREPSRLAADQAAMGLWLGRRADTSDQAVILDRGTERLPALMVLETGQDRPLRADDELRVKFHEVFTGRETWKSLRLGQEVPAGQVARLSAELPLGDLEPGYYLVVADVWREGQSLLGGRVGADDLYLRRPDESMTYTVLSIRTGMVLWLRDLLYGDIMGYANIALPHVYDPLDKETYPQFIQLFGQGTWKHTEGNEAGDTGLALAAEAFRKSDDMERCRFAEWLLEDSLDHMISAMQSPTGGVRMVTNELGDAGIGQGGGSAGWGSYDSNQIGEWMRALSYGIIYYSRIPEKRAYAERLSAACRKSADYLIAHAVQDSDGIPTVLRHVTLVEHPDGTVEQVTYHQEGRQCDVYLGRALAGLSYYAYALQLLGEEVPEGWWGVMDNTVRWCEQRMKPNGWFDWQCEDIVEGGCHTFLGNIYIGEGLFGIYLASRQAGRTAGAEAAAGATRKAYHYVTDDCVIKGVRFRDTMAAPEFWVGPYVYWLFTEYGDTVERDAAFEAWLAWLDRTWSVDRGWRDFVDRPAEEPLYRTTENGMLAVAILGYLGIKQMEQIGQPLHWELP